MKKLVGILVLIFSQTALSNDISGLYNKAYGNPTDQGIVFIHGGPGYNSWDFEASTAKNLADKGFYVVVYDERGQGRSRIVSSDEFNYDQYSDDLKSLIEKYRLKNPILLGHSHGGPIALEFDKKYPGIAQKIALVSAPVRFMDLLESIFDNCSRHYFLGGDLDNFEKIGFLRETLLQRFERLPIEQQSELVAGIFNPHAANCRLYNVLKISDEEAAIHLQMQNFPLASQLNGLETAMPGFLQNNDYIHQDRSDYVMANRSRLCGIYGDEDGLFTAKTLSSTRALLRNESGVDNFSIIYGASHALYINQQTQFFEALKTVCQIEFKRP